jgi:DNA-binding transcriptional LysR family regulator
MDLKLRQLRCLVAIVDTGSFTDATVELGVSQAAVSRTSLSLERVLGVRLLHRTSRSLAPTTAGVQVLARARLLLAEADNLVREAKPTTPGCDDAQPSPWPHDLICPIYEPTPPSGYAVWPR